VFLSLIAKVKIPSNKETGSTSFNSSGAQMLAITVLLSDQTTSEFAWFVLVGGLGLF